MLQSLFGHRASSRILQVNALELFERIGGGDGNGNDLLLVDVRSPHEYQYDGHIEGARLLPLQVLMQRAEELPRDQEIVMICRSGNRSMVACEQLSRLGFTNVKNFRGGMISWKKAGLPTR